MRVFMVEDSQPMLCLLTDVLGSLGDFEVVAAATTELAATAWLDKHPGEWNLATLDLLLGDGTGLDLIQRCRAQGPAGKIVVFSAFVTPAIASRCKAYGADAVIVKSDFKALAAFCAQLSRPAVSASQ